MAENSFPAFNIHNALGLDEPKVFVSIEGLISLLSFHRSASNLYVNHTKPKSSIEGHAGNFTSSPGVYKIQLPRAFEVTVTYTSTGMNPGVQKIQVINLADKTSTHVDSEVIQPAEATRLMAMCAQLRKMVLDREQQTLQKRFDESINSISNLFTAPDVIVVPDA